MEGCNPTLNSSSKAYCLFLRRIFPVRSIKLGNNGQLNNCYMHCYDGRSISPGLFDLKKQQCSHQEPYRNCLLSHFEQVASFSLCLTAFESRQPRDFLFAEIEKKFRVFIKTLFFTGEISPKLSPPSAPSTSMIKECPLNFIVIAQGGGTPNVLDTQLSLLHSKELKKIHELVLAVRRLKVREMWFGFCMTTLV